MTIDDLTEGLTDLANDVRIVDLRPRVRVASRRLRTRRIAGVVTAGVCSMLLAIVLTASMLGAQGEDWYLEQSVDGVADGPVAYYLLDNGGDEFSVLAWSVTTDDVTEVLTGDATFAASVAISPDGLFAAYYTATEVIVEDLATRRVLSERDLVGDTCLEPSWYPDSSAVYVADATMAMVASADDGFTSWTEAFRPDDGCHARYLSFRGDTDQRDLVYQDADGENVRYVDAMSGALTVSPVAFDPEVDGFSALSVSAVSPTGEYLCVDTGAADASPTGPIRSLGCDLLTGYERVGEGQLPVQGELRGAVFPGDFTPDAAGDDPDRPPERDAVLRMNAPGGETVLVDSAIVPPVPTGDDESVGVGEIEDLDVEARFTEPESLGDAELLAFVH